MKGILSAIIFIPLIGAAIIGLTPRSKDKAIKWVSLLFVLTPFVLSLIVFFNYNIHAANKIQFVERLPWIKDFGVSYFLGVDGLSLPLVVLSTLTMVASVLYSFVVDKRSKEYFILMLIMASAMVGVFIALDYILFYIFWEVGLVPMYFLIGIWGSHRREYAAIKFFLFTFFGSVFMLIAILGLYFYAPVEVRTFDMIALAKYGYSINLQILVFLGVFIAMAIKLPLFPFHTWLPDAHVEAPTAASVILAGVLLKMGGYGVARILMPTVPDAFVKFVPLMATMGIISIIYGAYLAMAQDDLKKMVAYSSISHMGFVILGFAAINIHGISGAVFQMVSHGLITGMMFILVGMIHDRYHTRKISQLRSLLRDVPGLSFIIIITSFAALGMPAFSSFIGEWLSIAGVFSAESMGLTVRVAYAILMAGGIVLTAGYFILMMAKVFLKDAQAKTTNIKIVDLNFREISIALPIVSLFMLFGVYPKPILTLVNSVINTMLK